MKYFLKSLLQTSMHLVYFIILYLFFYIHLITLDLPNYNQLIDYQHSVTTKFYSKDNYLVHEYSSQKRLFTPIKDIPIIVQNAFIAAEDKNFYLHHGIDFFGLVRAILKNTISLTNKQQSLVGGSTITQQVVKNFLLTNDKTLKRKIKEAILAVKISHILSKERILELYLNQIYLGSGNYGITSASLNYFDKDLQKLSTSEAATLASLPKSPSTLSPKKSYKKTLDRRNWVLERMYEEEFISKIDFLNSKRSNITIKKNGYNNDIKAHFFAESVRKTILNKFGEKLLYEGGLFVKTTLDNNIQKEAELALQEELLKFDKKKGYRGVEGSTSVSSDLSLILNQTHDLPRKNWHYAIVEYKNENQIIAKTNFEYLSLDYTNIPFPFPEKIISKKINIGDIIIVEKIGNRYQLQQKPRVNGAMVILEPHLGKVKAIVGGIDHNINQFDRATQAKRQTGSVFKSFVYLSALENGYAPNHLIDDSPIQLDQGKHLPIWEPKNYNRNYLGPTTLRRGLELSRNIVTVKLAQEIGIEKIIEITKRLKINDAPLPYLSIVLGSMETSLLKMTAAYAMIVNGGKEIDPTLIEKIQDRSGKNIYTHDNRTCIACNLEFNYKNNINAISSAPITVDNRKQIIDQESAYQITSILEGAMQRNKTAQNIRNLNLNIGGKTGTTNNNQDAWFIGFTPDMVIGIYVGYDEPRTLGHSETGATVAQPIFVNFMKRIKKDIKNYSFIPPKNLIPIKIDYFTGEKSDNDENTITEYFKVNEFKKNFSFHHSD